MSLQPEPLTYAQLADVLDDMAARVRAGDSFEGSITYGIPETAASGPSPDEVLVRATYRVGNSQGQGGVRMIGTIKDDTR